MSFFEIFFFYNFIIIFIFQLKLKFILSQCPYSSCLSCIMCNSEEIKDGCYCTWNSDIHSCSTLNINTPLLDEWYKELENCDESEKNQFIVQEKQNILLMILNIIK